MSKLKKLQKILGRKDPEPAATPGEIKQLKLELVKANLKKQIAEAKAATPKKKSALGKIFDKIRETKPKANSEVHNHYHKKERKKAETKDEYKERIDKAFGNNNDASRFRGVLYR